MLCFSDRNGPDIKWCCIKQILKGHQSLKWNNERSLSTISSLKCFCGRFTPQYLWVYWTRTKIVSCWTLQLRYHKCHHVWLYCIVFHVHIVCVKWKKPSINGCTSVYIFCVHILQTFSAQIGLEWRVKIQRNS